jgi:MFS family permease
MEAPVRHPRPWAAVAAATFLNLPLGSLYAFSVLLKPLEQLLGATRAELAAVFAVASIALTVGMNLAPYLFRTLPAAALMGLCVLLGTAGIAWSAFATSLIELGLGYGVLFGLAAGVAYILAQQGVNLAVTGAKGLVNGYVVSLWPLGAMLAAPLFGWALAAWGVRGTLAALAAVLAVTGLAATVLMLVGGVVLSAPASSTGRVQAASQSNVLLFWKLFVIFLVAASAGLMVLSQAAGIVAAYGGGTVTALVATTYIPGAIAAARLGGGWLTDRAAVPTVMALAQATALAGALVLTLWPSPQVAGLALALIGVGYGLISGSTAGAIALYWPAAEFGRIAGRVYIAWCIAAVSLPVVAGHLYDLTGGYGTAVVIAGCGNLIGVLVALALPRRAAWSREQGAGS